jgi:hypothetical protein
MDEKLALLKAHVTELVANPDFVHHKWFITYHLVIVEQIARELLAFYPDADQDLVLTMAWMHDYGKILNYDSQYSREHIDQSVAKLKEFGFEASFAEQVGDYIEWMDKRNEVDLREAPIEVQIVSSADAGSHFASPFHPLYWYENPDKPIEDIVAGKPGRISTDWDRKLVLPEARAAFAKFYEVTRIQNGQLPKRYL